MQQNLFRFLLLAFTATFLTSSFAQERFVTDQLEITLRSGPSTSNSIRQMLKSGEKLEVIEEDATSGYSKVQLANGRDGYVLTRYLDSQPSGRQRAAILSGQNRSLQDSLKQIQQERETLLESQQASGRQMDELSRQLEETLNAYEELQEQTRDTVSILEQNRSQREHIRYLEQEKQRLSAENASLMDNTAMDWFVRGAGVSLAAFLLGILVTRVRWKKRDSWGDF